MSWETWPHVVLSILFPAPVPLTHSVPGPLSLSPSRILLHLGLCTCYNLPRLLFPQKASRLRLSLTLGFCSLVSLPVREPLTQLSEAALGPFLHTYTSLPAYTMLVFCMACILFFFLGKATLG